MFASTVDVDFSLVVKATTGDKYDVDSLKERIAVVSAIASKVHDSKRGPSSSGGCSAGLFAPLGLLVLAPLVVRKIKK